MLKVWGRVNSINVQKVLWALEELKVPYERTDAGMVGINVGIPVPFSIFPFSGHKQSFFGDLHAMGKDGVAFYTETKSVTSVWFTEEDSKKAVSTWDGTLTRK